MIGYEWLPEMARVDDDWDGIINRLYAVFAADFKNGPCTFEQCAVDWDRTIRPGDQYEEGFWHLITKTRPGVAERDFDVQRAQRLPWCGPTIKCSPQKAITIWEYLEAGNKRRVYLWLEDLDYVIILQKNGKSIFRYFLVTAYHVDGDSSRRSLEKKYGKREQT